jgi:hypothetical protein
VNKHVMMEQEFVTLKRASENRKFADKRDNSFSEERKGPV